MAGSTQPVPFALSGFVEGCEGQTQPCWYGVIPGQTTVSEFTRISRELDLYTITEGVLCGIRYDANNLEVIINIHLLFCEPQQTGELMGLFSESPSLSSLCNSRFALSQEGLFWNVENLNAHSTFTRLVVGAVYAPDPPLRWDGFATRWRYLQQYPEMSFCGEG
jgi:hypothetical protein